MSQKSIYGQLHSARAQDETRIDEAPGASSRAEAETGAP